MPYPSPEEEAVPRPPPYYYPQWMPPVHYLPPPRPIGIPDARLFRAGAVGMILMASTGILAGISFFVDGFLWYSASNYPIWVPISGVFVMVSSILCAVGYFGKYKNYGSAMGAAAGIYLLIGGILFFVLTFASIRQVSFGGYYYSSTIYTYYTRDVFTFWGGYILFGVAPILLGVSHIISRHHMLLPGLNIATGVLLIIGGSFIISLILSFVGFFIMCAAGICGAIAFAKAPVYDPASLPPAMSPPAYPPAYGWSPYRPEPPY